MINAIKESMISDANSDESVLGAIRDIFAISTADEILNIYIGNGDGRSLSDKMYEKYKDYPSNKNSKIYEIANKYKMLPRDPFTRNPAVPGRYDIDLDKYEEVNYEKEMDVGFGTFIRRKGGSIARVLNEWSIYYIYGSDGVPIPFLTYNPLKYYDGTVKNISVFRKKMEGGYRMKRKSRRHLRKRVRKTKTTRRRN